MDKIIDEINELSNQWRVRAHSRQSLKWEEFQNILLSEPLISPLDIQWMVREMRDRGMCTVFFGDKEDCKKVGKTLFKNSVHYIIHKPE